MLATIEHLLNELLKKEKAVPKGFFRRIGQALSSKIGILIITALLTSALTLLATLALEDKRHDNEVTLEKQRQEAALKRFQEEQKGFSDRNKEALAAAKERFEKEQDAITKRYEADRKAAEDRRRVDDENAKKLREEAARRAAEDKAAGEARRRQSIAIEIDRRLGLYAPDLIFRSNPHDKFNHHTTNDDDRGAPDLAGQNIALLKRLFSSDGRMVGASVAWQNYSLVALFSELAELSRDDAELASAVSKIQYYGQQVSVDAGALDMDKSNVRAWAFGICKTWIGYRKYLGRETSIDFGYRRTKNPLPSICVKVT